MRRGDGVHAVDLHCQGAAMQDAPQIIANARSASSRGRSIMPAP